VAAATRCVPSDASRTCPATSGSVTRVVVVPVHRRGGVIDQHPDQCRVGLDRNVRMPPRAHQLTGVVRPTAGSEPGHHRLPRHRHHGTAPDHLGAPSPAPSIAAGLVIPSVAATA
jgi:hypothetical protein